MDEDHARHDRETLEQLENMLEAVGGDLVDAVRGLKDRADYEAQDTGVEWKDRSGSLGGGRGWKASAYGASLFVTPDGAKWEFAVYRKDVHSEADGFDSHDRAKSEAIRIARALAGAPPDHDLVGAWQAWAQRQGAGVDATVRFGSMAKYHEALRESLDELQAQASRDYQALSDWRVWAEEWAPSGGTDAEMRAFMSSRLAGAPEPDGRADAERWRRLVRMMADADTKVDEPEDVAGMCRNLVRALMASQAKPTGAGEPPVPEASNTHPTDGPGARERAQPFDAAGPTCSPQGHGEGGPRDASPSGAGEQADMHCAAACALATQAAHLLDCHGQTADVMDVAAMLLNAAKQAVESAYIKRRRAERPRETPEGGKG